MTYTVRQVPDFAAIEDTWWRLLEQRPDHTVFATPTWQQLWWRAFHDDKDLLLLTLENSAGLSGIAPLMQEQAAVRVVGSWEVTDYLDLVILPGHEETAVSAFMDDLMSRDWTQLDFHCLPGNSPTLAALRAECERRGLVMEQTQEDVCPQIELPASWDDYLNTLSKKDRHELRRKFRRLMQQGDVKHSTIMDPEALPQAMDDFIRLHRASRPEKDAFMTPQVEAFFRAMAACFLARGWLRLDFLEVDGVRVSSTICFDYHDVIYLYNSGYDPEYSALSVGLLLKAMCIEDAIQAGKRRFDFLRGDEPYKYDLGGVDQPIYHCVVTRS